MIAKKFRVTRKNIWASELKYYNEDGSTVRVDDSILFNMNAIDVYFIIHKGGEDEQA